MKKMLLLGYSYIAQKAILPALHAHSDVQLTAIASVTKSQSIPSKFTRFDDYKTAIDTADCDTVYISLRNSDHIQWILYALKRGKNVICDKPVVLNADDAKKCVRAAKGRLLFEAIPYLYHPQHDQILQMLSLQGSPLQKIAIQFGFPMLAKENFRNTAKFGGGCIFDIGPYIVSTGEYYFGKKASRVFCSVFKKNGLPLTAAITFEFGKNETLQATVGFGLEYRNHLELWGNGYHFSLDRAFTIPPDFKNTLTFKQKDTVESIPIPPSDTFANMFSAFAHIKPSKFAANNKRVFERICMLTAINASAESGQVEKIEYN